MRVLTALMLAALVLASVTTIANAQSYSSALTSGITHVSSSLVGNTYTWTLQNNSHLADSAWDVLVWSLVPYNVHDEVSVTSPSGWSWSGTGWQQWDVQSNQKYYTPPAIGPGQSLVFTYTFNPLAPIINVAAGEGVVFLAHVGAVVPGSGNTLGTTKWSSYDINGGTWHDASTPEPASLLVLGAGFATMLGAWRKTRPAA